MPPGNRGHSVEATKRRRQFVVAEATRTPKNGTYQERGLQHNEIEESKIGTGRTNEGPILHEWLDQGIMHWSLTKLAWQK